MPEWVGIAGICTKARDDKQICKLKGMKNLDKKGSEWDLDEEYFDEILPGRFIEIFGFNPFPKHKCKTKEDMDTHMNNDMDKVLTPIVTQPPSAAPTEMSLQDLIREDASNRCTTSSISSISSIREKRDYSVSPAPGPRPDDREFCTLGTGRVMPSGACETCTANKVSTFDDVACKECSRGTYPSESHPREVS